MNIFILLIGLTFTAFAIYLFKTDKDPVNKPKLDETEKQTGTSSLFDKIVSDNFEDGE